MSKLQSAAPIWTEGAPRTPELMTKYAAQMLARRITAYWRKRGHTVVCRVERMQGEQIDGHGTIHCVRSNMVNGCPR
jgi:hypothetical protein